MIRKWLVLSALILLCVPSSAWGQRKRGDISAFVGYQWGGGINTREGRFELVPGINYGAEINVVARREGEIVLLYNRQDTEVVQVGGGSVPNDTLFGVAVNYFQVGGAGIAPVDGPLKPYVALTLGMTWLDPKQAGVSSSWRFSGSLGGGVKFSPTERIGFRAQGRWWFNVITAGSQFWCGLPGGCWVSTTGTVVSQGEVSGGLMVNF
jgi:opacity protein-like surface antigen